MLKPRAPGVTMKRAREAEQRPHDAKERFDPDFPIALLCSDCGKYGYGPFKQMAEAMREHRETSCSARKTKADKPHTMQILFPRT